MECPHLNESIVFTAPSTKNGCPPSQWCCSVCETDRSPWLCLTCGIVNCGRYVHGHAVQHFEKDHQHCVCLDCNSYAAYCYSCDEFILNDTESKQIDCARKILQELEELNAQSDFESDAWVSDAVSVDDVPGDLECKDTYRTVIIGVPQDSCCAQKLEDVQSCGGSPVTPSYGGTSESVVSGCRGTDCGESSVQNSGEPCQPSHEASSILPSCVGSSVIDVPLPDKSTIPLVLKKDIVLRDVMEDKIGLPCSFIGRDSTHRGSASKENREVKDSNQENRDNNQENKHDLRRRKSTEAAENNKKRLKTDDGAKMIRPRTSGLRNLGNTCFMNAVLQSLSNIQHFCGYIKQLPSLESKLPKKRPTRKMTRESNSEEIMLVEELRKTLVALWQGSKTAISPESLFSVIWKVVPRFRGYQQQDAHEFMRYLLDRLHTELLTLLPYPNLNSPFIGPKGKSTIVTAIFGGILQNEVRCLICGIESKKHDPFLDLSLDIPPHFTAKTPKPKEGESLCTLQDCLKSFTDVEELEESELYMCSNCKQKQRSTKKFWIRRLPNVLCLHLKRFRWSTYFRVKVETYVQFPLRGLEMTRYVLNNLHETRGNSTGSNGYDLAAVIVHHGSGAGSGHYTAYATHEGLWYHFNDSTVTVCDEETVVRCKAYILFYVRRQVKLPEHLSGSERH
ncbi:ubiquitin carboxyl-terminal hydrolase 3-like [Lineus longissimus]|uniref:ubiquitin carboxyl-terminal hydrolase 3-like n=1 Tax=Lineus longissimus TaxID=88925 RepID=UPI002B4E9CBB